MRQVQLTVEDLPDRTAPDAGLTAVGSASGAAGLVTAFDPDGAVRFQRQPFPADFTGGVRVAVGDFNGDGTPDVAAGTGPGAPTRVVVYSGTDGAVLFDVAPFEASFRGGVYVSAGDVSGDGRADLVVSPDEGGGPRMRVYDGVTHAVVADFYGIDDPNFRGGARTAVGDVNADGVGDLVVAAGFGGGPRVAVFDGRTLLGSNPARLFNDFYAFEPSLRNGAYVAAGDLDGDGRADLIFGGGPGGGPRVLALSAVRLATGGVAAATEAPLANFFAGNEADRDGIRVAVGPGGQILTSGVGSQVRAYTASGQPISAPAAGTLGGFVSTTLPISPPLVTVPPTVPPASPPSVTLPSVSPTPFTPTPFSPPPVTVPPVSPPPVTVPPVSPPPVILTSDPWVARHGLTAAQYQSEFNTYTGQGYRLTDISGYEVGGQARYAALWEKKSGPAQVARHGLTGAQYQTEVNTLAGQGYRPVLVDGYTVGGQVFYAAIFETASGVAWGARHGLTAAQYQAEVDSFVAQGYRLVSVSGYAVGSQDYYAAVFDKSAGPAWAARHGLTSAQYQSEVNSLAALGYQPTHVSGYNVGGQDRYAAIWVQSATPWAARHGLTAAQYQAAATNYLGQGYRLKAVNGYTVGGEDRYIAVWQNPFYTSAQLQSINQNVTQFMQQYGVPGASMAIAKDDRLVYASGFGVADQGTGEAVTTDSRFRIASVSKPITSAAIFKLIDQGKLKLTDKVFGTGALLGTQYGANAYSTAVKSITVQHLLEHTAGGWGNSANDPMFSNPTLNLSQLMGWVLDNRPLTSTPGATYDYSNFGYCVLGRVIEKVTGQGYAAAVQNLILTPSGITGMTIGGNTLADRQANEVRYYGQGGQNPYGMQVSRMDAHGGWVASAADLLRFAVRVNGQPGKADILSAAAIAQMTTGSTANGGYAKGWAVNSVPNWWHDGSLPGTASILVRTASGYSWSMLLNTRSLDGSFFSALDNLMWKVVNDVGTFPTIDLWP